jgi:phosphorylcholine metabolism protein LicD
MIDVSLIDRLPNPDKIKNDISQWNSLLTKKCIFHLEKSILNKEITVLEEAEINLEQNEKRLQNYKKLITLLYFVSSQNENKEKFISIFNPGKIITSAKVLDQNNIPFLDLNAIKGTRDQISSLLILRHLLNQERVEKLEKLENEIYELYSNPIKINVITLFGTYQNRIKAIDFAQQIESNNANELALQVKSLNIDISKYSYINQIVDYVVAVDELKENHTASPQLSEWLNLLLMTLVEKDLVFSL